MTYNELLYDSIKYDEEKLAYAVYWLIKNNVVKGTDNANSVNWDLVNYHEVEEMKKRNELDLKIIKLYTMPIGNNQHFLVFAVDEKSARGHCLNELGMLPEKVFDITDELDMSFWFPEEKKYKSLREIRDATIIFPATAMIFDKDKKQWR